jgi:SAM-dependent methyltransferase
MRDRSEYGQLTGLASPFVETLRLRQAVRQIPRGSSILDIGCGRAGILRYFPSPPGYVGVDIIPEVIEQNRRRFPGCEFHVLNVEEGEVASLGEFDVILMLACLEHFTDPERVMMKITPPLKAGGRIVLTTPHPRAEGALRIGSGLGLCSRESHEEHHRMLDRIALQRLAADCGLRLLLYRPFLFGMNQLAVLAG